MTSKSFAKVNIYLKVIGIRDNYHLISSRFMLVESLFDTITFKEKEQPNDEFELIGKFSCKKEQNLIFKAYQKLLKSDDSKKVAEFFKLYKVVVNKNIPEFAGLGGGSSNVATFLKMSNEFIGLRLSKDKILSIGRTLGADVAFFINGFSSANVEGIGEKVVPFKEEPLSLEVFTPDIKCETKEVYKEYRKSLLQNYDKITSQNTKLVNKLESLKSSDILEQFDIYELNDLFDSAVRVYPSLENYAKEGWFFSGSGSSFFKKTA